MSLKSPLELRSSIMYDTAASPVPLIAPNPKRISPFSPTIKLLSDLQIKDKTNGLKQALRNGKKLDDILPDAFALVREAAIRTLGQRHYDVQILGGIALHNGKIAEMKTGEGKTLVSTLSAYLNALSGLGVHIVTVNDYLASRDSEWMGAIYKFLGLSVGCIKSGMSDADRKNAYLADITYGTNNEFGFDYLRDNMKFNLEDMCQRSFNYAIIDEVDSILIDEARTPLVISGAIEDNTKLYNIINNLIKNIEKKYYEIDEKSRSINLNSSGIENFEKLLYSKNLIGSQNLYAPENIGILHHINQALKANFLFTKDKDYLVKDNQVVIVDEFTGRMMEGRRFSDGLHQAIEAKENVQIQNENQTLASVTFQNYFRMYPKLSGMTGTAKTEAAEFSEIYGLDVLEIPPHKSMVRNDLNDEIYRTNEEKWQAVVKEISKIHEKGQPLLVGTTNIKTSELISKRLKRLNIKHEVLNARFHEKEAIIISQAGKPFAVTRINGRVSKMRSCTKRVHIASFSTTTIAVAVDLIAHELKNVTALIKCPPAPTWEQSTHFPVLPSLQLSQSCKEPATTPRADATMDKALRLT